MSMQPPRPIPVLLLKQRSGLYDSYRELFRTTKSLSLSFEPHYIPVLNFHTNRQPAISWIRSAAAAAAADSSPTITTNDSSTQPDPYGGLIFTSQHAVEAFSDAWESTSNEHSINSLPSSVSPYTLSGRRPPRPRGSSANGGYRTAAY